MSQPELLKQVVAALGSSGIPYMLTGSYASSFQGEPRLTHDIDLVIAVTPEAARTLLLAFAAPNFYLDENAIAEAFKNKTQFNLIDVDSGDKVDFWVLTEEPFDQSRFARRYLQIFRGQPYYVSGPEDTILMKLRWAEMSGGSEKQLSDAKSVYELQAAKLDLHYLETWAQALNVIPLLNQIRNQAAPE